MNIHRHRLQPDYEDAFYESFPLIFADVLAQAGEAVSPLTDWGIECGTGWRELLTILFARLEELASKAPVDERPRYRITQIKNKIGRLTVYMRSWTPEMRLAIEAATERALTICESCGADGEMNAARWRRVQCEDPGCPGGMASRQ